MLFRSATRLNAAAGRPLSIQTIYARDRHKDRGFAISGTQWADNLTAMTADDDLDILVECVGGTGDAVCDFVRSGLAGGKAVITANKALLAERASEVWDIAPEKLYYEAAVAGAIPVIKTIREGLAANEITRIRGILNGTCNYILSQMAAEETSFEAALADAQAKGYAEADPAADVKGTDTAHKLAILSALAFGGTPSMDFDVQGITDISPADIAAAQKNGRTIKLIAEAFRNDTGKIIRTVKPTVLVSDSPLGSVNGVINAVEIETNYAGPIFLSGAGAGGEATASAVIADILDAAKSL